MAYQQLTRAELRALLKERFEGPFWTDTEANLALNESLRIFNLLTGYWRRRVVFSSPVPFAHFLSVPNAITFSVRVEWGGYPLNPSSIDDLNKLRTQWRGETTLMGGDIPNRPTVWAPAGLTLLAVWPADAAGCAQYVVDGVSNTPTLEDDAQFLDLGQEELHAILCYGLHYLAFKEGGERFLASFSLYQQFIQTCGEKNSRLKATSFYRRAMGEDRSRFSHPLGVPSLPLPAQSLGAAQGLGG